MEPRSKRSKIDRQESFDVTCVIGTVSLSPDGDVSPHVAAFTLIAQHDAPGTFIFPGAAGGNVEVTVGGDAYDRREHG